jgi:ankyrin repeat protein
MLASAEGDLQRSKDLVAYGANVNATSYNGSTALMYAARNNHLSIVKLLIENGADKEIENEKKSTALSLSQTYNSNEVNEYLKSLSFKL